jgi:hypothetical protein
MKLQLGSLIELNLQGSWELFADWETKMRLGDWEETGKRLGVWEFGSRGVWLVRTMLGAPGLVPKCLPRGLSLAGYSPGPVVAQPGVDAPDTPDTPNLEHLHVPVCTPISTKSDG